MLLTSTIMVDSKSSGFKPCPACNRLPILLVNGHNLPGLSEAKPWVFSVQMLLEDSTSQGTWLKLHLLEWSMSLSSDLKETTTSKVPKGSLLAIVPSSRQYNLGSSSEKKAGKDVMKISTSHITQCLGTEAFGSGCRYTTTTSNKLIVRLADSELKLVPQHKDKIKRRSPYMTSDFDSVL